MITYFEMTDEGRLVQGASEKNADWIHFEVPTKHEMYHFAKKYHLPTMLFEVAQDINEVARYETFTTETGAVLTHICLLVPVKKYDGQEHAEYITRPFSMIISGQTLLTVGHQQASLISELMTLEGLDGQIETLALRSVSVIYQRYLAALAVVAQQIEQLEKNVHTSTRNRLLYALKSLKKSVVYLDLGLKSNQQIMPKVKASPLFERVALHTNLLYRIDIQFAKSDKAITTYRELLEQLSALLSDIISNRLNNIMKTLTSLSIVLTVPTILGGFWGMNVPVPLANSKWGFLLLLGLSLIISITVGWWLKKRDYF
ncbi:magnesium transporter CorA family protein [Latilactobacillus graminis]|uniref:CorA-like Mg2+ transporter family protein n=2 Tax=Latilactobacillus graminis TaxID=60519 RepID=A0AA89L4Q3_9LACO|nr:magnesium transporter CorA family protein [Latilactobacillus graminis]KRM24257.1 corA-like Mg2+ transporter family protein [Latilactobacillus graminis DSM 20719]QFP78763.1 magnesium transporter CorA family protein [Latilactobacillus graminis]